MATPAFDLQSHSTHSDGALAPADVVGVAARAGVQLLALTDHDSAGGVVEAAAAAREAGIGLVAATEMTALLDGRQDLHILGYLIDPGEPVLSAALERSRTEREHRAQAMSAALAELGFELDEQALAQRAARGETTGRPHLAQAVVSMPGNRDRLVAEGLLDPTEFLVAYLIEGKPAFKPRAAPTVERAIELIHGAGGVAVWAHPFWDIEDPATVSATLDGFAATGLDGVECFYPSHTREQTGLLVAECATRALLRTGSSDFHGPEHGVFSRFLDFDTYGLEPDLGPLEG
jgi:hypothetical protein